LATGLPAAAQTVTFGGEIRERSELDDRSRSTNGHIDLYHLLRSRLAASAAISPGITALIQLQDSRTFGEEGKPTSANAGALDLHQGYIEMRDVAGVPVDVRLGRTELGYANERLIGKSDWSNTGQAFDGITASVRPGDLRVDLLAMAIGRNPAGTAYTRDVILAGAWGIWSPDSGRTSVQAYYLYDDPRVIGLVQNRNTAGAYTHFSLGALDAELDGAAQFGDYEADGLAPEKISASMIGARLGYLLQEFWHLRVRVGYDRLSGNRSGTGTHGEFSTLYGTNHKFYGLIDYLPPTSGFGLQDLLAQLGIAPAKGLEAALELHDFLTATDPADLGLVTGSSIGRELDVTFGYRPARGLALAGGFALFDGAPNRPLLLGRQVTTWSYLTATASF
jgi:hypothetical protein